MLSYEPLFKLMEERDISGYHLIEKLGFDRRTFYRMKKGNHVKTTTLIELCRMLDCEISDIIRYIPTKTESE